MPFADRQYRYDAAGQLTRIEDAGTGNTEYRYDPIGRLLEAVGPMHRERFAFDPASNIVDAKPAEREEKTAFERRQENALPPQVPKVMGNLLKQYAGMHFVYDARGNLTEKQSPAGQQRYEWDAFNRLKAATVKETSRQSEARYFYDPLGRRIAKEVNGERTVFGWDGDTLAYETNSDSSTHYVYEAGSFVPLAQFVTSSVTGIETPVWKPTDRYLPEEDPLQRVPQRTAEARVFYYHCDQIGTPLMMTDDVGDVVWEASYKAWGEARKVIERASKAAGITPRNPIRFQGQQFDPETGLAYNRHRYYDAATGRFISADPIGLRGGFNLWQYGPNPLQWTDPLGLSAASDLPRVKGKSVPHVESILGDAGFSKTKDNGVNQTWKHTDGSEVRVHKYGNKNTCPYRSGNNAHVHKEDPTGNQLNDRGMASLDPNETHIGIRNPADLPTVRGRPHGS